MIPLTLEFARESKGVNREIITIPDFISLALEDPTFEGAVVGTGSIYNIKTKTVFIYPSHLQEGTLFTHQSIARKIVEHALKLTGRRRYPSNNYLDKEALLKPPIYCKPVTGDLVYIDLKSAYFQIYKRMPLYPREIRGRWNDAPPYLADFLPLDIEKFKLIRNSIGGLWRANVSTRISGGKLVRTERIFPTTSFDSWQLLQTFLHTIGRIAIYMGAYYVNNDGYIFRTRSYWQDFVDFLDENGLKWEIKAIGAGEIRGIGMYSIGELQTKRLAKGHPIDSVDTISPRVLQLRQSITKHHYEQENTLLQFSRTPEQSDFPF